jgi:hypothetical protein
VQIPAGAGDGSPFHSVQTGSVAILSNEYSPGVKGPGRKSDHTTPSSVEIKHALNYTSTPPYCLDEVLKLRTSMYLSVYICLSVGLQSFCYTSGAFSVSYCYTQSVGLLRREINPTQGRCLHTEEHKQNKSTQ